jgi:hypothetical protein
MVTIYDDKRRTAGASNSYMGEADQDGIDSKKFQLTVRLIDEFQEKASHNNSCFMLVNLPAKGQKLLSEYADGQEIPPYVVKCDTLLQALNKNKMKALDLVPVFSSLDESLCYFKHEGHMTKFGHQVIASSIQKAILPVILQIISETREKERV